MKHPKPSSRFGLFGALLAWGAYFLFLVRGLPLMIIQARESGSTCATGWLSARADLIGMIPWILLSAGIGWGLAVISKSFMRTARLAFIGCALTSLFCLASGNAWL